MRSTITLDADTEALIRRRMREKGVSFKEAVNDAIRTGLGRRPPRSQFQTRTARLGTPTVNLDRALQLAGELEDEELVRKMRLGK
ncbi:MAG: antitoxin [Angustibacter sp.]